MLLPVFGDVIVELRLYNHATCVKNAKYHMLVGLAVCFMLLEARPGKTRSMPSSKQTAERPARPPPAAGNCPATSSCLSPFLTVCSSQDEEFFTQQHHRTDLQIGQETGKHQDGFCTKTWRPWRERAPPDLEKPHQTPYNYHAAFCNFISLMRNYRPSSGCECLVPGTKS